MNKSIYYYFNEEFAGVQILMSKQCIVAKGILMELAEIVCEDTLIHNATAPGVSALIDSSKEVYTEVLAPALEIQVMQ